MGWLGLWGRGLGVGIAVLAGLALIVPRIAPTDVNRWHRKTVFEANQDLPGGVLRQLDTGPYGTQRLAAIALRDRDTRVFAGAADSGLITLVSRSPIFEFPDYTTVWMEGHTLKIHARLRFGYSDLGVNKARVERWLSHLF